MSKVSPILAQRVLADGRTAYVIPLMHGIARLCVVKWRFSLNA